MSGSSQPETQRVCACLFGRLKAACNAEVKDLCSLGFGVFPLRRTFWMGDALCTCSPLAVHMPRLYWLSNPSGYNGSLFWSRKVPLWMILEHSAAMLVIDLGT